MIQTSLRGVACFSAAIITSSLATSALPGNAEPDVPTKTIDLRTTTPSTHPMSRIYGPGRDEGDAGVPVAGGFDCDGDGHNDYAVGHFLRDPLGRNGAGIVSLIFGDGTINDTIDLATPPPAVLTILGAGTSGEREACGSEIWMGDVTGDGMGDLLICRQNYSPIIGGSSRVGAGALTVVVGSPQLRAMAEAGVVLDFANPPAGVSIVDLVGAANNNRMGIWARVGDIDGDGIDDVLAASDQENATGSHSGAAYVLLGGSHLDQSITLDMANFGSTALAGKIARITPPSGASHYHLGSTNQTGDLDGNGRAEIFLSAALNRSGAAVSPSSGSTHATGGAGASGECFIVWDDNFPVTPWPAGYVVSMQNPTGSITRIRGGGNNDTFGEELLGGKDYDGDGNADFFVGDLTGDATGGNRPWSGAGYVIFNAEATKGLDFNIDNAATMGLTVTTIIGPSGGAIGADTVADGDLDGDGFDDLIFGSPTDSPLGRNAAGTIQIFFGQSTGWPTTIDTAPNMFPSQSVMRITEVLGANGSGGFGDSGDTLCYSAAAGDLDDDGLFDLFVNEMRGNGVQAAADRDAGNLLVLSGGVLSRDHERIGTTYCMANGNSTGGTGTMTALGSTNTLEAYVQLEAGSLPQNTFGYFLASLTQGFIANPGGSTGNICLGLPIGRYAGNVLNTGLSGSFQLFIDTGAVPQPTGSIAIQPGDTWSFQTWHRDTVLGAATSNFTQGLAIVFN